MWEIIIGIFLLILWILYNRNIQFLMGNKEISETLSRQCDRKTNTKYKKKYIEKYNCKCKNENLLLSKAKNHAKTSPGLMYKHKNSENSDTESDLESDVESDTSSEYSSKEHHSHDDFLEKEINTLKSQVIDYKKNPNNYYENFSGFQNPVFKQNNLNLSGSTSDNKFLERNLYMGSQPQTSIINHHKFDKNSVAYLYEEELNANENRDWWDRETEFLDKLM
jgi:hypothetical protein